MYRRAHHQRIAHILASLEPAVLRDHGCLFGGGTCIALRFDEYRESLDIYFLVSDAMAYRDLRQRLTGGDGLSSITRTGAMPLQLLREVRADQYGIRTQVLMNGQSVKFEIVREARFALDAPSPDATICGIDTLTTPDLATSKLLANSDRWADDSSFNRDLIDLAMLSLKKAQLGAAMEKANEAYGQAVMRDLMRAIERIQHRQGWLDRCMLVMAMSLPKAVLWKKIRQLKQQLPPSA